MKKTILAVALLTIGSLAFAQTLEDSASIRLSGVVEKNVSIAVSGLNNFDALDLTADVTDLDVVSVVETSNVREGYTVSLASTNASAGVTENAFFLGDAGGETLTYLIKYDGAAVSFSGGVAEITNSNAKTGLNGQARTLSISYSAADAHLGNDFYSDDLTFTITAK